MNFTISLPSVKKTKTENRIFVHNLPEKFEYFEDLDEHFTKVTVENLPNVPKHELFLALRHKQHGYFRMVTNYEYNHVWALEHRMAFEKVYTAHCEGSYVMYVQEVKNNTRTYYLSNTCLKQPEMSKKTSTREQLELLKRSRQLKNDSSTALM